MTIRLLRGTLCLSFLAVSAVALAGGPHHGVMRKLGIGYSDGYHAKEGCPIEQVGGWKHSYHPHQAGGHSYAGYGEPAPAFADQYRSYAREPVYGSPMNSGLMHGDVLPGDAMPHEIPADRASDSSPTPALPPKPVMRKAPQDPMIPTRNGHAEARLPSSMFPLTPIR